MPGGENSAHFSRRMSSKISDGAKPYRIVCDREIYFIDRQSSPSYYVSVNDGTLTIQNRWTLLFRIVMSVHTFERLRLILQTQIKTGLLIFFSLLGIFTALTGNYLAVQPWLRQRRVLRSSENEKTIVE